MHCGVQNAEQFLLTSSASPAEVEACQNGLLVPGAKDFRFDFNEGYRQSRWNNLIIDKIVDYACASEDGRRLHPVPRGWLVDKLRGQMFRAREAWARPQPRGNETEEEATVRANEYREIRAANVRGNSAKARVSDYTVLLIRCFDEERRNTIHASRPSNSSSSSNQGQLLPILSPGRDSSRC